MDRPKRPEEDKHLESRDHPRAKRRKTSDDGGEVAIYNEERVEHGQDAEPIENLVFPTPRPTVSPERVVGGEEEKEGEKEEGGVSDDGQNETDDHSDNDSVGLPSLDLFQWPAGDYDPLLPIPDILLRPSYPSSHDSHDSDSDSGDHTPNQPRWCLIMMNITRHKS
ncbi:hypothetical protein N0V85_005101 [Neurospora sp. IMI 360204]|nr:hypothetical protein N0V85_005101 [Neurospora sp. IMI 360204]